MCLAGAVVTPWFLTQQGAGSNCDDKYVCHWKHLGKTQIAWFCLQNAKLSGFVPYHKTSRYTDVSFFSLSSYAF